VYQSGFLENWQDIGRIRKPIIAAVSGYAVSVHSLTHSLLPHLRPLPIRFHHAAARLPNHSFLLLYYAQLGGGCELALMADILLAAPNAKFGQPEVNIGTITGGGGSQRLAHAVGKSRAMELVLTGRMWSAQEAAAWGMVSRVVEQAEGEGEGNMPAVVREAVKLAGEIASKSQIAVQAQKEAVNAGACPYLSMAHCDMDYLI
jgi:enoyl-CoA hydratase